MRNKLRNVVVVVYKVRRYMYNAHHMVTGYFLSSIYMAVSFPSVSPLHTLPIYEVIKRQPSIILFFFLSVRQKAATASSCVAYCDLMNFLLL